MKVKKSLIINETRPWHHRPWLKCWSTENRRLMINTVLTQTLLRWCFVSLYGEGALTKTLKRHPWKKGHSILCQKSSHSFCPSFTGDVSKMHESVAWLWLQLHFEGMSQRAALKMQRTIQVDDKSGRTSAGPFSHYRAERDGSEAQNRYTGEKASENEGDYRPAYPNPWRQRRTSAYWGSNKTRESETHVAWSGQGNHPNVYKPAFDVSSAGHVCFAGLYKPTAIHHNGRAAKYFNWTCVKKHRG